MSASAMPSRWGAKSPRLRSAEGWIVVGGVAEGFMVVMGPHATSGFGRCRGSPSCGPSSPAACGGLTALLANSSGDQARGFLLAMRGMLPVQVVMVLVTRVPGLDPGVGMVRAFTSSSRNSPWGRSEGSRGQWFFSG